jgi:hypothetical protein
VRFKKEVKDLKTKFVDDHQELVRLRLTKHQDLMSITKKY